MAAATSVDMMLIANDTSFKTRVQALLYQYCIITVGGNTAQSPARKLYAAQVLNSPNTYVTDFVWACAQNQTLANDVVTANGGTNFTPATSPTVVAAAVTTATPATTGASDSDIANAIAAAFNILANA